MGFDQKRELLPHAHGGSGAGRDRLGPHRRLRHRDRGAFAAGNQVVHHRMGAVDHLLGQPRQASHLNAVALVGFAGNQFAGKYQLGTVFANGHIEIFKSRKLHGELGQLVVVGGEQGQSPQAMDELSHSPCNADAVVCAGSAAYLVQHDEALRSGVVENVGRLVHLQHERGLTPAEVIGGPDAGEDAIHQAKLGPVGRHEGTHLGHQCDEGHLAHHGGFAGHIGPGEQHDLRFVPIQHQVVGHELLLEVDPFDHRMPAGTDGDAPRAIFFSQQRPRIAIFSCGVGQGRHHVDGGDLAGGGLHAACVSAQDGAQRLEFLIFEFPDALFGSEDLLFDLFQPGRGEPLVVDQGLLALVVVRDFCLMRPRHLDVVPEYLVEADLEGRNAGAFPFLGFETGDDGLAVP